MMGEVGNDESCVALSSLVVNNLPGQLSNLDLPLAIATDASALTAMVMRLM